tara:strand:+ start:293 stop:2203 length:1911 start_codon:yes stop_codon:yes gene_type:complete
MAFLRLKFNPGVNRDTTNYSGEGSWWDGNKVRFISGQVQKIGGWLKTSTNTFFGVCRQMCAWNTTFSDIFIALGTNNKLYIEVSGAYHDITPLRATNPTMSSTDTDNCIVTTNGSTTVTVNLGAAYAANDQSFVTIAGVTGDVGGIPNAEINANHLITAVDSDTFTFVVASAASSGATGGGTSITIKFEIAPGYASDTIGYGWSTGTWGREAWGSAGLTPIDLPQRDWWVSNFDNDLVASIRDGAVYYWARGATADPATSLATRAILLSAQAATDGFTAAAVPVKTGKTVVSSPDKHLIAFGAVPLGSVAVADYDPLLIRWADQDSPTDWTPATTNSSGFLRVSRGSSIIATTFARQEHLIWTETNLYGLQFLGTTNVFGLQEYEANVSIISPRAMQTVGSVTYWMGREKFYAYTGRVETLPCTLIDYVFQDINYFQVDQIISGANEEWNEVWWFYCSAGSNWNDRYVVFNHLERIWYYGTMERTAWLDTNLKDYPQAATTAEGGTSGYMYNHEYGNDADGAALAAYIESSAFDLGDGDQFMLSQRLIPDVKFGGSDVSAPAVTFQLIPKKFPGAAENSEAADTQSVVESSVDVYTEQVFIRARARQMALKIASADLGVRWHLGAPRLDVRPDGRR